MDPSLIFSDDTSINEVSVLVFVAISIGKADEFLAHLNITMHGTRIFQ